MRKTRHYLTSFVRLIVRRLYPVIKAVIDPWWRWLFSSPTFYTRGRDLYDNDHTKIVVRGINLPLLDDWDFPKSDTLSELAQTGANAVRIQWYITYPDTRRQSPSVEHLDAFIERCRTWGIIPIVELHDLTCKQDTNLLNSVLMPWWTRPDVMKVLTRHRRYLIINLANELGHYRWAPSPPAAMTSFVSAYKTAITAVRAAGLNVPIMIDAPDCGTSIKAFTSMGQELVNHDPRHNVLLSVHAYWSGLGYDGLAEVVKTVDAKLPIVFGEIANKQDEDEGRLCFYDLDGTSENHRPDTDFTYQKLLSFIGPYDIGWLAWSWWPDGCASRQMSSNGRFGSLTPYGKDLVYNSSYGLLTGTKFRAVKTASLPGAAPP